MLSRRRRHPARQRARAKIEQPTDAIVRLTASAICGTDLHMVRGTMPGMGPGTILGHEGVGVVEEVGRPCATSRSATGWWSPRPSAAGTARTARRLHLAVRQRQPERQAGRAPRSSAARDHRPDQRPPGRVRPRPARRPDLIKLRRRCPTTRRSCSPTSSRQAWFGARTWRDVSAWRQSVVVLRLRVPSDSSPSLLLRS